MLEYRAPQSAWSGILAHFRTRAGHGSRQDLRRVTYHLLEMILARYEFDDVDSLLAFCKNSKNLQTWLPSESDRVIFSAWLVEGLLELSATPA